MHQNQADPKSLTVHPAAAAIPDLPPAQYAALKSSIERQGILQPLLVDDAGRVIDGRHRLRAAIELGLDVVPVATVAGDDAALIACDAAVTSRNLTTSGRVLILFLAHPDLQRGGVRETSKANLLRGSAPNVNYSQSGKSKEFATFAAIAERYGVPREYFSTLAEILAKCRDEDDWRAAQRMILDDEISIPRVNAGIGGRRSTTGTKRSAPSYGPLAARALTTLTNSFRAWSRIEWQPERRASLLERFDHALSVAPPEIRGRVTNWVLSWPAHEQAEILKELRAAAKKSGAFGG